MAQQANSVPLHSMLYLMLMALGRRLHAIATALNGLTLGGGSMRLAFTPLVVGKQAVQGGEVQVCGMQGIDTAPPDGVSDAMLRDGVPVEFPAPGSVVL